MGQLIEMSNTATMGTCEIADLLNKQHYHIKVSAQRLAESGVINGGTALRDTPYINEQNKQTYFEYRLNKRDSIILVAQNCPEFTARIVDRWQELEQAVVTGALQQVDGLTFLTKVCETDVYTREEKREMIRKAAKDYGCEKYLPEAPSRLPLARTKAASKKPRAHAVAHGLTFEQAIQEFVANMSGTGTMPTEDAYLLFCEMYGTNMARRNKFVAAVRVAGADKRPMRFDGISRQGFIFH